MRTKDMSTGSPYRLILGFSLPLMAGNIFQQLYTVVDAAFVGRFAGIQALAAVGSADWFNWLVMGALMGFAQGFSILVSQRFGAGDEQGLRRAMGNSVTLALLISVLFLAASQLLVGPVLVFLDVPVDIRPQANLYLRILFAGIPVLCAYNVESAFLRAVGNAKTPLWATVIASIANIALDALFVIAFRWGVAGAAAATVIAQGASALYCFLVIRKMPHIRFGKADLHLERETSRRLIFLATPTALQNGIIGAGGMAVSRVVNGFGELFIAAYTATNKLYGILEMAAVSYGAAIATYAGQNFGARKLHRIKKGVNQGAVLAVFTALLIAGLLFLLGRPILSLFIDAKEAQFEQVMSIALSYLHYMLAALVALYLLYVYRSALQGMGDTVTPMISGIVELAMRVGCAMILPAFLGHTGVFIAEVAAWIGAVILLFSTYLYKIRKLLCTEVH